MVNEVLAARGIIASYETVRQWACKFGQVFANQVRRRLPAAGDKWPMDEVRRRALGSSTGCGARPTRPPPGFAEPGCWTSWYRAGATRKPPSACCARG